MIAGDWWCPDCTYKLDHGLELEPDAHQRARRGRPARAELFNPDEYKR